MKTRYIYLLFLTGLFLINPQLRSQYQVTYEANHPRQGDKLIKSEVAFKDPGRSGKDVLWDFSSLTPVEKPVWTLTRPFEEIVKAGGTPSDYAQKSFSNKVEVSYYSQDAGRTIIAGEQGQLNRYNASGDSLLLLNWECPTTQIANSLPEVWLTYPFGYKDKISSYFAGNGIYCERLGVSLMGEIEVQGDAYGMIILPNKDTLTNVLRVVAVRSVVDDREPVFVKKNGKEVKVKTDSIAQALKLNKKDLQKKEVTRWYAQGYRYPVFETIRTYTDKKGKVDGEDLTAFFYYPADQEADYMATDEVNRTITAIKGNVQKVALRNATAVEPVEVLNYNFYPNPTRDNLHVELFLAKEARVNTSLYTINGKVLYQTSGHHTPGVVNQVVPMASYPRGTYILKIEYEGKVHSEKVVKQ